MEELIIRAENGDVEALRKLSHYYFVGNETGKIINLEKSLEYAKRGADLGDIDCVAQFALIMSIRIHTWYAIAPSDAAETEIDNMELALRYAELATAHGKNIKLSEFKAQLAQLYFHKYIITKNREFLNKSEELIYEGYPYDVLDYNETYALILTEYRDEFDDEISMFYQDLLCNLVNNHMDELKCPGTCCYALGLNYILGCGTEVNYNSAYIYLEKALNNGADSSELLALFKKDGNGNWYMD